MAKDSTLPAAVGLSVDEKALVEQARAGDMGAFSRLVGKYQERIVNTCWRVCGNKDDAEDLAQEAILKALEAIGSFQQRAAFYTWLFRIAVNVSIAHRRKAARAPKLALHAGDGEWGGDHQAARLVGHASREVTDPLARLSAREVERKLAEGLEQLDDDHRAVIVLRDIEGFDYRQIGEILDLPAGTVRSRIHRARLELKEYLRPLVE
ncbi:MAG TPA: sigma-70 family RNA polymerase sigma factor [Phycisphaerae bacterium]|nr:sigma-70 family RNA polymerase sigma factor [Phycisphaerae bacterium]HRY66720.1 sigma-70 family RNA polymerase sigma factor [Phycisphaerae bacterium]HSA29030.1 sigma-70 family RNA polymerase sigma factor [Phycisphaerae bacterium]